MANLIKHPSDEGIIQAAPDTAPCTQNVGRWVLAATILGSSMAMIDGTAVNVALPVLQRGLNATVADVQWVVEIYALFLASLILVGGSLGDLYGRKRIFAIGIVLFTLASVGCGFAQTIGQLTITRAIQGIGGALMVPGSLAMIGATFSKEQRGKAIGTWAGFTVITGALGPVLGGWLVQNVSWRAVFFLNIPVGIIVLSILFLRVPESRGEEGSAKLDWLGAVLTVIGLGAIVYALITSNNLGLGNPLVLASLALGVVALVIFVLWEARHPAPMVPLTLFRSRTFSGTNLFTLLLYSSFGGVLFFFPFNLIQVQGYSPEAAGAALLPMILLSFLLSRWSGGLVNRYGARLPLIVGPMLVAIGLLLYTLPGVGGSYWLTFFPAILVQGLGFAVTTAPLTTTVMGAVEVQHAGLASGINNAVSRTAALLSVAVLTLIFLGIFVGSLNSQLTTLGVSPQVRQQINAQQTELAAIQIPASVDTQTQVAIKQAIDDSFVSGFRGVMYVGAVLALLSTLIAFFTVQETRKVVKSAPATPTLESGQAVKQ